MMKAILQYSHHGYTKCIGVYTSPPFEGWGGLYKYTPAHTFQGKKNQNQLVVETFYKINVSDSYSGEISL